MVDFLLILIGVVAVYRGIGRNYEEAAAILGASRRQIFTYVTLPLIGSGIFIVSADISRQLGSAGWLIAVWLLSGFITLAAALSYGELSGMYPKAGGQYVYLREAFGKHKNDLVFMDFIIDPEANVFPMVAAGKGLSEMILAEEL